MKKHRYVRLENLERYDGWDLVEVIPARDSDHYAMGIVRYDDTPNFEDIIKQQQNKNKELEEEIVTFQNILNEKAFVFAEDKKEEIKTEAIKRFAENAKEELYDWVGADNSIPFYRIKKVIDNLVKEMVGEQ